jgi:uncharacterized protein (DUF342 family)
MAEAEAKKSAGKKRVRVKISKDYMMAAIVVGSLEPGDPPLTTQEIIEALNEAGVVHGIGEDWIQDALAQGDFGAPVKVAEGTPVVKGQDTRFEYFFYTDHEPAPKVGSDGRIDYRDMNFVQNVAAGQVLARMTPPTEGTPGKGVHGKELSAPRGRNIPFSYGENCKISEDGTELVATADGAVVFAHGRVSVKDVMVIKGDVDFSVGNIDCVGSVRVGGRIQTGFTVKAGGNLEVNGNVEDANVSAGGDILVRGGFFGNGEGVLKAEGDVVVKYADGQKIAAGRDVIAGGELMNCTVTAKRRVVVKGKRGKIVGGQVNAGREVRASLIGSDAGTKTVLWVAYDANLMREYHQAQHELDRIDADQKRVKESLYSLYKLQMDNKLNQQQTQALAKLEAFQKSVPEAKKGLEEKKKQIAERMQRIRNARVVAEIAVYPGVDVHIGVLRKEIEEEAKVVQLIHDGYKVLMTKYQPGSDD